MNWTRVGWEAKAQHPDEAMRPSRRPLKAFPSRFPTRCFTCHGKIPVGGLIVKSRYGHYVHAKGCPRRRPRKARYQGGGLPPR